MPLALAVAYLYALAAAYPDAFAVAYLRWPVSMTMIHMRGVHGLHTGQYLPTSDPEVYHMHLLGLWNL